MLESSQERMQRRSLESIDRSLKDIADCLKDIRGVVMSIAPKKKLVFDDEDVTETPWLDTVFGNGFVDDLIEHGEKVKEEKYDEC